MEMQEHRCKEQRGQRVQRVRRCQENRRMGELLGTIRFLSVKPVPELGHRWGGRQMGPVESEW